MKSLNTDEDWIKIREEINIDKLKITDDTEN